MTPQDERIKELEKKLAEAQRIKVEYDRWLSNGVYYTYEEYERDIRPLLNQQAQLTEAQRVIKDFREELEVIARDCPSGSPNCKCLRDTAIFVLKKHPAPSKEKAE